jgi:ATP-binding cassette subfamily C (CFTR/MRP) protein 1
MCFQACTIIQTLFNVRYLHNVFLIGTVTKSALTSVIYRKSLKVSETGKTSTGQLVNLMSVDTQKIADVMVSFFW